MPGENLDFSVMLPYLKNGTIVVLHDLIFGYRRQKIFGCATPLLLSAVVSEEKFLNYESKKYYPNIGAFRVDEQTRQNIENVFLALMLRWDYIPNKNEIDIYRAFYNKHYPANLVEIFDKAVIHNIKYKERFPSK